MDSPSKPRPHGGTGKSPFRYPGGKLFIADLLSEKIQAGPTIDGYAEAYAGGAGAAIELLARGVVQRILLNDFDRRISAAWKAIIFESDRFIDRIKSTKVDMPTWYKAREIVEENDPNEDEFELGFSTFFLNRTNRSGIIIGAGPIGGYDQKGKWLIDARFYPETIIERIKWLKDRREKITISNMDGIRFLRHFSPEEANSTFFFIDPPYVQAGAKLYLNAMTEIKHRDLAKFLLNGTIPHWLVTYDDCPLIRDAYALADVKQLSVKYSLHRKRIENEVCVEPRQFA